MITIKNKLFGRVLKTVLPFYLFACLPFVTSCTDYQDEIDALDYRVTVLENLVKTLNTDIEAMKIIVEAMEDGDYITGVKESDGGYLINFANAGPVFIKDGVDGLDGKDAEVPNIDVVKDADGNYYWVIDGQYVTDDGKKIRVNGKDGKDGKDAVAPQVRINPSTSEWEISVDGGTTWTPTGTSAKGKDGADGKDGKDGNQFFVTVTYEVNSDGEFMTVTTKSGQTFKIPIYKK
jgi:hypothetical protein